MPNNLIPHINDLTPGQLLSLEESIDAFLFKQAAQSGEPFHDFYRGNKFIFKKLVYTTIRLQNNLKRYFKTEADDIAKLINLHLVRADDNIDIYINGDGWQNEDTRLVATIEIQLNDLFNLGVQSTEINFNQETHVDSSNTPQAKFLRKYNFDLVKQINDTTKDRIREQIKTSIHLGETRDELTARLAKVVNNPVRARMIAQTESIRAFGEGRLATGKAMGVKEKQWQGRQASDALCGDADGQIVGIDEEFKNGAQTPPAHPNCRCSIRLILDGSEEISRDIDPADFYK